MTTDAHPIDVLVPKVLWAQRKDKIFLSIEVFDAKDEKVSLDATSLAYSAVRGTDNTKYAVDLEFYAPLDVSTCKRSTPGGRAVNFIIEKVEKEAEFWPRLVSTKAKLHYIHTDFSKWVDEDEEAKPFDMGDYSNFNYGGEDQSFGEDQELGDEPELEEDQPIEDEDHVHGEHCNH